MRELNINEINEVAGSAYVPLIIGFGGGYDSQWGYFGIMGLTATLLFPIELLVGNYMIGSVSLPWAASMVAIDVGLATAAYAVGATLAYCGYDLNRA
jgi:hypothetical protein